MKEVEPFGYIQQLDRMTLSIGYKYKERLTRLMRSASRSSLTNSARVLFEIHSQTICKGSVVTPMKGAIFGCLNLLHMMAASNNDYKPHRCC